MAKKKMSLACYSCDSEFKLEFLHDMVIEKENIICPFCGEEIEDIEESERQDFDDVDYMWDDDNQ